MTEKQLFSVLVRMLGVLVVLVGLRAVAQDLMIIVWPPTYSANVEWSKEWLYCSTVLVLGAILVRWPDWVVHLAWLEKLPTIGRPNDDET
jgi:hypothetical protein